MRDGGTTEIVTDQGVFYSPTVFSPELNSTFTPTGGEAIGVTRLDPAENGELIESLGVSIDEFEGLRLPDISPPSAQE